MPASLLRHRAIALTSTVFVLAAALAAGLAFAGSSLAVVAVVPLLAAGAVALFGWWAERQQRTDDAARHADETAKLQGEHSARESELNERAGRLEAELDAARSGFAADSSARDEAHGDLQARVEGLEHALETTRAESEARLDEAGRALLEERRRHEQDGASAATAGRWANELRRHADGVRREDGPLAGAAAFEQRLLRTAMGLVGARAGALLFRHDDGVRASSSEGWPGDPGASRTAGRVSGEALAGRVVHVADGFEGEPAPALGIPVAGGSGVIGVLVLAGREGGFAPTDESAHAALGAELGSLLEGAWEAEHARLAFLGTVAALGDTVEGGVRTLGIGAWELAGLVDEVAVRLGLAVRVRSALVPAALLRDVGKTAIADAVLTKPEALTAEERRAVQLHPEVGARIVARVPVLLGCRDAVRHHHERWDGAGYPDGLAGEAIPVEARVLAVGDAFRALTADRAFRHRRSRADACAELERGAATQFDPAVARLWVEAVRARPETPPAPDVLREALTGLDLGSAARRGRPPLAVAQ